MTDARFFGILLLLSISILGIGFVLGYCCNSGDDHD